MNRAEVAKLLTFAAAMDNRKITQDTVEAWFATIGDLPFDDALEAARIHYRDCDGYLDARAVMVGVKRIRRARLAHWTPPAPQCDPSDVNAYLAELRSSVTRRADGLDQTVQIERGTHNGTAQVDR